MKRVIKAAKITDYIDADTLDRWMLNPNFGIVSSYRQLEGMIVETVNETYDVFQGTDSATERRYWKFIHDEDGTWKAYELDKHGNKFGHTIFYLD